MSHMSHVPSSSILIQADMIGGPLDGGILSVEVPVYLPIRVEDQGGRSHVYVMQVVGHGRAVFDHSEKRKATKLTLKGGLDP